MIGIAQESQKEGISEYTSRMSLDAQYIFTITLLYRDTIDMIKCLVVIFQGGYTELKTIDLQFNTKKGISQRRPLVGTRLHFEI